MPFSLNLQLPWQHVSPTILDSRADIRRFKYDASKCTQYCQHLQQQIAQCTAQMSDTNNVDMAVQLLHDCICNAAAAVHGCPATRTSRTQHRHQPWFDTECRSKHKEVSTYAKFHPNSHLAREWKKQLKQLLRRKKRTYKKLQGRQLCALAKTDPASFWRQYSKTEERSIAISKTDLVTGFQKLLEGQCPSNTAGAQGSSTDQVVLNLSHPFASDACSTLNCDITLDEIAQVMRRLKCNKSAGLDGIKAEFLLDAGDMLHVPLHIVFNKLLQQGYSASLSTGVIHALHKGGDALRTIGDYSGSCIN
jgi:hypothetical protein